VTETRRYTVIRDEKALISLALNKMTRRDHFEKIRQDKTRQRTDVAGFYLVWGVGFEPTTFRL
jgi:hypothetical protein